MKRSPGSSGSGEEGGENGTTGVAQNEPLWRYRSRHDWPKISPPQRGKKKNQFIAESRCPLHCETSCRALWHPSCQLMLKRSSGPIGEGLCHKRFGVSTTFRIFTSHLSVSLVTQRQFFTLRAFNHIYCSDMTDVVRTVVRNDWCILCSDQSLAYPWRKLAMENKTCWSNMSHRGISSCLQGGYIQGSYFLSR